MLFPVVLDRKEDANCNTGGFELIYKDNPVGSSKCVETKFLLEGQRIKKAELQKYHWLDQILAKESHQAEVREKEKEDREKEREEKEKERATREKERIYGGREEERKEEGSEAEEEEEEEEEEALSGIQTVRMEWERSPEKKTPRVTDGSLLKRNSSRERMTSPRKSKKRGGSGVERMSAESRQKVRDLEKIYCVRRDSSEGKKKS